jgi:hypothetical protein
MEGENMAGGVIVSEHATGDVYFVDDVGKEVLPPAYKVEVQFTEEFGGMSIPEAIEEAKRFAIGAFKNKMQQRIRGTNCTIVPKNIDVDYKVKYGFDS